MLGKKSLKRNRLLFRITGVLCLGLSSGLAYTNDVGAKKLRDVTERYRIETSGYRYDRHNDQFVQEITLSDPQGKPLPKGLQLHLDGLSQNIDLISNVPVSEIAKQNGRGFKLVIDSAKETKTQKNKAMIILRFNNQKKQPLKYQVHVMQNSD